MEKPNIGSLPGFFQLIPSNTRDLKFVFKTATSFSWSVKLGEVAMRPNTKGVVCILS